MTRWRNWSGRITADPAHYERPTDESALQSTVAEAAERGDTIRVAGSGHSFSPVVPSDETLISLERYTGVPDVDTDSQQVTVRAGTTLADLNETLAENGLAMSNLGDIDRQTVAGALMTGTHGTGLDFGVLASQIAGLRLLTADGEFLDIEAGDDRFRAAQVSLGALGIATEVTLDVEPAYDLCLRRRAVPLADVLANVEQFHENHRQWEFFWFPHTDRALVKTFDEVPPGADQQVDAGGGSPLDDALEDAGAYLENAVWEGVCRLGTKYPVTASFGAQLTAMTLSDKTEVGPSHEVFANPRDVRFHESEYGVPAGDLPAVVEEIHESIAANDVPVQFPIECRFVGGDDPLLSPAHGRDSGFIAVHAYHEKDLPGYFETCEEIFDGYDGRPHWGKHHTKTVADLAELYPEFEQFQDHRRALDPEGVFLNDHLEDVFLR